MTPTEAESTNVQLARMEGKLDVVGERAGGLMQRVDRIHKELVVVQGDIHALQSKTQTLAESQIAEATKAIALAAALKEADEARRTKTETVWSPFNKFIAAVAGTVGFASVWIQVSGK